MHCKKQHTHWRGVQSQVIFFFSGVFGFCWDCTFSGYLKSDERILNICSRFIIVFYRFHANVGYTGSL